MEKVKKINQDLAVATEQLSVDQLQQASREGYKSVLNLRSPEEEGFLDDEGERAKAAGLDYVNIPVKPDNINEDLADRVLQQIDSLPKPLLTHCKAGLRSGAFSLMYLATKEGMSADEAMEKGKAMGFDCDKSPQMKEFFKQYISQHQPN
ncbi:beta-lactamase hydrolase domain-containing protein [Myxosarcina sp. GI1]|uniref:beta-lactamase hydrolase domain-containing protein n=1 Tax=Myxosarcina sp. GI1 TaxID=1541065 RepID=UPI00056230EA|nr:protein tyrosine phosphatase family protein [Myxosarcina sp. GI1]